MDKNDKKLPFVLTLGVVLIDQLTKWLVTVFIPMNGIGASFMGGFLRIIHARNTAIAFSIGTGMSQNFKMVFFSLLPLVVLGL
ncbi:MAG: signal peptidase II, partial [Spirochaetia bacterium]|nr:signal peptidase II [Spirochaetia bacterium]